MPRGTRPRLLRGDPRVREQRYVVLIVVVLGLGAAAPRAFYYPVVVSISGLKCGLEGVMVEERGEGVVVEAEAARHVTYVASWLPNRCSACVC